MGLAIWGLQPSATSGIPGNTIGNAIVYEAARAITAIYPNANLLQSGVPAA